MKKLLCLLCVTTAITGMTACGATAKESNIKDFCATYEMESFFTENNSSETNLSETMEEDSAEQGNAVAEELEANEKDIGCQEVPAVTKEIEITNQKELFSFLEIDTEYNEEEAEQVKEIALKVIEPLYHYNAGVFAEMLAEYSDIEMTYYGAFGRTISKNELIPKLKEEFDYFQFSGDETLVYNVTDVQTADSDDVFWKVMSMDSEMMKDLVSEYEYDMSEIYTFDKAYKVILDVTDESNPENDETGVQVYVVRTQDSEWKFETIFNFYYDSFYYDSDEFTLSDNKKVVEIKEEGVSSGGEIRTDDEQSGIEVQEMPD